MQHARLPVVHDMLGHLYSDREWEALCNRCGKCCYQVEEQGSDWVRSSIPCRFLDDFDKTCQVYTNRFQAEESCTRVTPSLVLRGRLPPDCTYVVELGRIIEEDYDGEDPRMRRRRRRDGRNKRPRRRGKDDLR